MTVSAREPAAHAARSDGRVPLRKQDPVSAPSLPDKVRVDHNSRGEWEVALPGEDDLITCADLEEAQRVAYLCATRRRPCELILCDAYHRVLRCELLDGRA